MVGRRGEQRQNGEEVQGGQGGKEGGGSVTKAVRDNESKGISGPLDVHALKRKRASETPPYKSRL